MDLDPHLNKAASIWLNPKLNINKKYLSGRNG